MNHLNTQIMILAVDQPKADLGPFDPLVKKLGGLIWAISATAAMFMLLGSAAMFVAQKYSMGKSDVYKVVMEVLFYVGITAIAANIVNWIVG